MSLITQCPACTTMFKVVPDQLRVSEGWVRCGQCDEVFDANAHLYTSATTLERQSAPAQLAEQAPEPEGYDWGPVTGVPSTVQPVAASQSQVQVTQGPVEPEATVVTAKKVDHSDPPIDTFLEKSPQELSEFQSSDAVDLLVEAASSPESSFQTEGLHPGSGAPPAPSFLARNPRPSRPVSFVYRSFMVLCCLSLAVLFATQVLVHERDRIAATQPVLVPLIESVCALAGCEIAALHHIDAVVIDSSSFAKAGAQTYKLQFTIKNTAAMTVATPALELTLTDTQERALVRRVVKPEEFGSRRGSLSAGDELSATLPIQIRPGKETEKIAGYRLFAFYP